MRPPRTATCSSRPEQEPRLGPCGKRDWNGKLGQSDGVTANKGLSLGEKRRLAEGRARATRGPRGGPEARRRRVPRWGRSPSAGGVGGGHSRGAGPRARPGGRGATRTATAPPRRVPGDRDLGTRAGAAGG